MTIKPASLAHDAVAPVGKAMSDRIKIARTLCIFFMTFVHVQAGIAENVYDRDAGFFDIIYFILTRLMGLSSVSLLSVVSGYFIVSSLLKAGPPPTDRLQVQDARRALDCLEPLDAGASCRLWRHVRQLAGYA